MCEIKRIEPGTTVILDHPITAREYDKTDPENWKIKSFYRIGYGARGTVTSLFADSVQVDFLIPTGELVELELYEFRIAD